MPAHKDQTRKTWYFKTYYTDIDGKRKQKLQRGFKKRSDALDAERQFLNEIERVKGGDLNLQEVWDHRVIHTELGEGTKIVQKQYFKNHILPHFENKLVSQITVSDLNAFKLYLTNSGLASSTQKTVYTIFLTLYHHAIINFNLEKDEAKKVKNVSGSKKEINPIEKEEFMNKVSQFKWKSHEVLSQLLFNTGLRIGEAIALTWKDIDIDNSNIYIYKIYNFKNKKITYKTKTRKSQGTMPFPAQLKDILIEWKNHCQNKYKYFNEDYYLFEGLEPIRYVTYRHNFKKVFPNHRIHDLRHSYASYLANNGVELIVLKELMRHESITTTADTYSHIYDDKKRKAIEFFDE